MSLLEQLNNFAFTHPLPDDWGSWGGFAILAFVVITVTVIETCVRWLFK